MSQFRKNENTSKKGMSSASQRSVGNSSSSSETLSLVVNLKLTYLIVCLIHFYLHLKKSKTRFENVIPKTNSGNSSKLFSFVFITMFAMIRLSCWKNDGGFRYHPKKLPLQT